MTQTITETPRFASEPPVAFDQDHMSVLIAVDTSGSVAGEAIRNINANLNRFRDVVCEDEVAARCVDVCVMSFDDTVRVIQDWCPVRDMHDIELVAGGLTDLNGAVLQGIEKIRERSRHYASLGITERKPYLILMTDGYDCVTGNVDEAADLANRRIADGKMKLFFLGFGRYDKRTAAQLNRANSSGNWCFEVRDGNFDFNEFFSFVANSVKAVSTSAPGEQVHVPTTIGTAGSSVQISPLDAFLND